MQTFAANNAAMRRGVSWLVPLNFKGPRAAPPVDKSDQI